MATKAFTRGTRVVLELTLDDSASAAGMRCRVKHADGTGGTEIKGANITIVDDTVTADFLPSKAGTWEYRFWRTTEPEFSDEGEFLVLESGLGADPA
jgi:hypothetical protein